MSNKPLKYILFLISAISLLNLLILSVFSIFWRLAGTSYLDQLPYYLMAAVLSALIIAFLVVSTAPVLKDFLANQRSLLRLENLSHPLLLKLSLEAPGTYHHCLAVANLANKAAKAIGADSLLTRIGAYYHDIGKTINPSYYIENQKEGINIHEEMQNPKKSAKIILGHVQSGLNLANDYHFPKEVIAFISEHHGTSLTHFYYQAEKSGKKVKKSDFRYPGPKPLSRETAITMLADIIEARVRLLEKVTPEAIEEVVDQSIKEKNQENQLELSGLTPRELGIIRQSFIDTLETIYHQRVKY